MEKVVIQTKCHSYEVLIGNAIFPKLPDLLLETLPKHTKKLIVIDSKVNELYGLMIREVFSVDHQTKYFIVPSGESSKSIEMYHQLMTAAIEHELDRKSVMVAIGGGMVGDLTGFVSATYMRGIAFVQVPTTILAHDSSVGGKVAINHTLGKNLIGAFHQPELVLYDLNFLSTLPESEWRSGYAELFKHALLKSESFTNQLLENDNWHKIEFSLSEYLMTGIQVKKQFVEKDELEANIRAALNLGHTLAHGLETYFQYHGVTHGEAVMVGLLFAIFVSEKEGSKTQVLQRVYQHAKKLGYEFYYDALEGDTLVPLMVKDKKNVNQKIRLVLLEDFGKYYFKDYEKSEISDFIDSFKEFLNSME